MNLRKLFKSTNRKAPNSDGTVEASDIYYTPHNSHLMKNSFPNTSFVSNDDLIKFEANQNHNNVYNEKTTVINPQDYSKNSPQMKQRNSKHLVNQVCGDLKKVNMSDEYTDPFDKLALVDNSEPGYMEPYKQQGLNFLPKRQVQRPNYEDPWDHKKRMVQPNYDNPWDNQTTKYNKDSLESPSSSRSSLNKNRMVKLNANNGSNSSKVSPNRSPRLDRRLIKPANHEFKVPATSKQFDDRLIKAEPSLQQLRYQSKRENFQHPIEANQMASTLGPQNVHRFSMTKSHSLNFASVNNESVYFPKTGKSVSDNHLVHNHIQSSSEQINYEDPWDKNQEQNHLHLRSRSYDLRPFPAQQIIHEKSSSFDAEQKTCYEQPWDKKTFQQLRLSEVIPEDHLKSMRRFQHRQLELHPSEAINNYNINNYIWYHANITRDEAEYKLDDKTDGSFLVRKSESKLNSYSLSVRVSTGVIHMVIQQRGQSSWVLGEFSAPFQSVGHMVDHYKNHQLKISDETFTYLRNPISSYKYHDML